MEVRDVIKFENVSFSYSDKDEMSLKNLNFSANCGELVLLTGKSGSGKSTILQIINGIIPRYHKGKLLGEVLIDNESIGEKSVQELSKNVGSVFQNPKSQFFHLHVEDELTFGPANHMLSIEEINKRKVNAVKEFKLDNILEKPVLTLSGGEMQRLACASVYMNLPKIYVLDEPSSNLDSRGINELKEALITIKNSGATIIIAEHRMYYLLDLCDQILYMNSGELLEKYTRDEFKQLSAKTLKDMGLRSLTCPDCKRTKVMDKMNENVIIEKLVCKKNNNQILSIDNLNIPKKKIVALTGMNGAGKSTFIKTFSGIMQASATVMDGKKLSKKNRQKNSFIVMQDVNSQLSCESVYDELVEKDTDENQQKALTILESLDLLDKKDEHPFSLSGGQKQRVAIGTALFLNKKYMFFDEPTSGLDLNSMHRVSKLIKEVVKKADLVCVITHDQEFIKHCCDYEIHFESGHFNGIYEISKELPVTYK